MSVEKIFDDERDKLLFVILNGKSITKVMTDPNPICSLLENDIKFGKKLGEGNFGEVFEIEFPGKGTRRYAVKKAEVKGLIYSKPKFTKSKTFLDLEDEYKIKAEKIIQYNGIQSEPNQDIGPGYIFIPLFMKGCLTKTNVSYPRFDGRGYVDFYAGEHICEPPETKSMATLYAGSTPTSEFAISVLAGSLYRSGRSINFLDVFYFATCAGDHKKGISNQYTFMELIDSSFRKSLKCICEIDYNRQKTLIFKTNADAATKAMESICIQIIHSIYVYQTVYKIVHGDLHDDNVFLEFVNEKTQWKGQKLIEADYYEYKIDGKSLYIPGGRECPFIVKIGDWGIACKYLEPKIANKMTIKTGYDQYDGNGPWIPNFYTEMYDLYMIMDILYTSNPSNKLIQNILSWILGVPPTEKDLSAAKIFRDTTRPDIPSMSKNMYKHVSAKNLLTQASFMDKYYIKPPKDSKIILIGE